MIGNILLTPAIPTLMLPMAFEGRLIYTLHYEVESMNFPKKTIIEPGNATDSPWLSDAIVKSYMIYFEVLIMI